MSLAIYLPKDLWDIIGSYVLTTDYDILISIDNKIFTDEKLEQKQLKQLHSNTEDLLELAEIYDEIVEAKFRATEGKRINIYLVTLLYQHLEGGTLECLIEYIKGEINHKYLCSSKNTSDIYVGNGTQVHLKQSTFDQFNLLSEKKREEIYEKAYQKMMEGNKEFYYNDRLSSHEVEFDKYLAAELEKCE